MPKVLIDDALAQIGYGRFQVALLVLCGLGFEIKQEWDLEYAESSLLLSFTFAGEIVGGLLWGCLADSYGRRPVFVAVTAACGLINLLSAFSSSFAWLLTFRIVLGVALGGNFSVNMAYFIEFLPVASRGFRTALIIFFGIFGVVYTSLIGYLVITPLGWRYFISFCSLPSILLFFVKCLWKFESPRLLAAKGQTEEARQVLNAMAKYNRKPKIEDEVAVINGCDYQSPVLLLTGSYRLQTFACCFMWFFLVFAFYGITVWLPYYKPRSEYMLPPSLHLLVLGASEIPGLLMTMFFLDRIGRRWTLFINFAGCGFAGALFGLAKDVFLIVVCSSLIYMFVVGCWTVAYIYTLELYPTKYRSSSIAYISVAAKVGGILSGPFIGFLLHSKVHSTAILFLCSGLFLLGGFCSFLLKTETCDRRLQDKIEINDF